MHERRRRAFSKGMAGALWFVAVATVGGAGPVAGCFETDGCGECVRAVECVEACGGDVVQSGCCPCPEGTIDAFECPPSCETRCVEACGGPPIEHGCEACPDGTFDEAKCIDPDCQDVACCPAPYHGIAEQRCVWSCAEGTAPDDASGECQCQDGLEETRLDELGRRVCEVADET